MCQSPFSICPRIEIREGKLLARSSRWANLTCFGLYSCEATVDSRKSQVAVARRFFWFWKTKRAIQFHEIRCVAYDYAGPSSSAVERWLTDADKEIFTVGLRLHDQTYVSLFRFSGYKMGSQEEESRAYAERVSKMIGVPLSR